MNGSDAGGERCVDDEASSRSRAWVPGMPRIRHYDLTRPVEQSGSEVDFPPVANGLDYLISVTDQLAVGDERVSARGLKYAILHLQAAAEVLLKYRLQLEHWTLVFKDPGKAKKDDLASGELTSCTAAEAMDRLHRIVGLPLDPKDINELDKLGQTRNKLQHWGLSTSARAIEARAAKVLDFLLRFVDDELLPRLTAEQRADAEGEMERIRYQLGEIQVLVTKRMQRLRAELEPLQDVTVRCCECEQWALVVGAQSDEMIRCRFCGTAESVGAGGISPFWLEMTVSGYDSAAGVEECPDCWMETLVCGVRTASRPERHTDLCFCCGTAFTDLDPCLLCDRRFRPHGTETVCTDCTTERDLKNN